PDRSAPRRCAAAAREPAGRVRRRRAARGGSAGRGRWNGVIGDGAPPAPQPEGRGGARPTGPVPDVRSGPGEQRLDDPGLNGAALRGEAAPRRGCARGGCGPGPGYRAACGRALRAATRIPDSLRAVEPEAVEAAVPRGYRPAPPCPPAGPPTRLSAYRSVPLCGPGPGGGRGTVPPGL